ncbi:F-box/LRR-repeat protein [Camellia lanceoleosa]|uniref:F-box/LRR-repeat protein n=1 Tax=Camellia lanceoleosa TaxID=1840588 RepID=A0ACC0GJ14_9ERIC|nr:F-box/LRR-repeat protein [Camellia lanceoleosa]
MGSSSKWESLNPDLLLDIFSLFKPLFLISTVSLVCRSSGCVCFDHLFGLDGDNTLDFTILNCDCCRRLFGSKVALFKKAFPMKFLRGVMDVYRRDDDDGIRVTSITRMVFPSGLLQLTDQHLLYLAERSTELREFSLPFGRNIKHEGFSRAIRHWNGMEEMSIGPVICNNDIFRIIEAIGIKLQAARSPRIVRLGLNSTIVS